MGGKEILKDILAELKEIDKNFKPCQENTTEITVKLDGKRIYESLSQS